VRQLLPVALVAGVLLAVGLSEAVLTLRSVPTPAGLATGGAVFTAAASTTVVGTTPVSTPVPPTQAPPSEVAPTQAVATPKMTVGAPFDGQRALELARAQMELGPRIPGSPAHAAFLQWAQAELGKAGWTVEVQTGQQQGQPVQNVVARRGSGLPWIVLGAHYDSRLQASQDPDPAKRTTPVPAANDGAAGVAALVELARVLPADVNKQVWIVLLDVEDNGEIPGWDWTLGARYFVSQLPAIPDAFVLLDMIGDSDLTIYQERNSTPALTAQIWAAAARLGYQRQFIPEIKYSMQDDHTPFLQAGIPAVDLIDFDYPYWHTTADTLDKISAASLQVVGDTLLAWLTDPASPPRVEK
jgi:hypothetical protein